MIEFKSSITYLIALSMMLTGCSSENDYDAQYDDFVSEISKKKIGHDNDQWIEMRNITGEWEKVGLIFGYSGDFEECEKAIAGLASANTARKYRCVSAQK